VSAWDEEMAEREDERRDREYRWEMKYGEAPPPLPRPAWGRPPRVAVSPEALAAAREQRQWREWQQWLRDELGPEHYL